MNKITRTIFAITICAAVSIFVAISGCGELKSIGSVITSTAVEKDSGRVDMVTAYGYSVGDDRIAFAIFTNFSSESASGAVGNSWQGQISASDTKPLLEFDGSADGIEINGSHYSYSNGRVFLASKPNGKIVVKQLDLSVGDANREDEIKRLGKQQPVRDFLGK